MQFTWYKSQASLSACPSAGNSSHYFPFCYLFLLFEVTGFFDSSPPSALRGVTLGVQRLMHYNHLLDKGGFWPSCVRHVLNRSGSEFTTSYAQQRAPSILLSVRAASPKAVAKVTTGRGTALALSCTCVGLQGFLMTRRLQQRGREQCDGSDKGFGAMDCDPDCHTIKERQDEA